MRRAKSTWIAIALSAVTGLGHLYIRRYAQGVVLFALLASALNGLLVAALWEGPEALQIRVASQFAVVITWLAGFVSVLRWTVFTDRTALRRLRNEKIEEGLVHYLRNEHDRALAAFEAAAGCDLDQDDVDVLFHLGAIESRLGRKRRSERYFRRCLSWDPDGKWRREIERMRAQADRFEGVGEMA